ncbi:acyltransferase family protein [Pseudomonas sp. JDS28PS106]|uniref:acyltransferase family protein n=1 Tax=Pseudomonas sp. JDS28PS106 TaxID=2497235 RepID=UPI002FCEF627
MGTSHNPALGYRPEVDGLRAVAVLPVILYHCGLNWFPGGYVGVDVFFVISGYLITSIILAEMLAGRFSLVTFYERRARRILPALFAMMSLCVPAAWVLLDPEDFKYFAKSLVAVPLFSSNLLFWLESGYFDASADLKPLLHTWTLAVEEQYYLFFPLFLMAAWGLGRKRLVAILAVAAAASFVIAETGAREDATSTFYLLHARAWELLVGSFIAFYFSWRPRSLQPHHGLSQLASLLGLVLIGYAVLRFDKSTPFPGINALLPVMGAALVILFADARTLVGRALSNRVMVGIGMISYSAYLWHQPLFAFARHSTLVEPPLAVMLGLVVASLALAWLSWRFIEQPFRNKNRFERRQVFGFTATASVMFMAVGLAGYSHNGFAQRFNVDPAIYQAFTDPQVREQCDQSHDGTGWNVDFCLFGLANAGATPSVAVFGDSHSEALLSTFDAAAREQGETLAHIGLGGCLPLLGVDVAHGNYAPGVCETLAARQLEYVKQHAIRKVVLVARWTLYTDGNYHEREKTNYFLVTSDSQERSKQASRKVFRKALHETVRAYRELGAEVFIVAQVPQQIINPKNLYYRLARDAADTPEEKMRLVSTLSVPMDLHDQLQRFSRETFEQERRLNHARLVTLDDVFCRRQQCLIGDADSWYKDFNHLNDNGARLLAGHISELLAQ